MAEWVAENAGSKTFEDTLAWVELRPHALSRERLEEMARLFADPRGGGERTSAYEARRFTDDFLEYYHHAAPFRGEALVDAWASCREGGASQAACAEQAEQLMLSSLDPSITFDERVEACLAAPSIGHRCQSGYDGVQALVEHGTVPTFGPLRRPIP